MEYRSEFGFNKAIIVNEIMLRDIDKEIKKYYSLVEWHCELENTDKIDFKDIDELLGFENSKMYFIKKIYVSAGEKFLSNRINVYIESDEEMSFKNSETISVKMITDSLDKHAAFKKRMEDIFNRHAQESKYNFIAKNGILNTLTIFYGVVVLVFVFSFIANGFKIASKELFYGAGILSIFYYFVVFLKKLKVKYFPHIVFYIGDGISIYDRNENGRKNFFWTVIVGIILGIIFLVAELYLSK